MLAVCAAKKRLSLSRDGGYAAPTAGRRNDEEIEEHQRKHRSWYKPRKKKGKN